MKTTKIFLASSEELDYDRMAFGNLVRRLDDMYEKRGIRIKLFEWEDYDAAFNDRRKQDEYNDHVRKSDIFLALFYKKAGEFTIEEFDIASEEFKEHASPKVFTFCKDLQPGEEESPELAEFKKRLFEEMGHYWCRYDTRESLQLQFVMQLQLVESSQMSELKVEDGNVTMNGIRIASMDKLRFAAANEDYVRMKEKLVALPKEIDGLRITLLQLPDNDFIKNSLQEKLNEYNKLKEDFAKHQQLLFDTAKRVAQLQNLHVTDRMRRAMDALSEGKVREANIILDEAEIDAKRLLEDYKESKEITELKRQILFSCIEELTLKVSSVMADANRPIEERITHAKQIYAQADEIAREVNYDKEKNINFLYNYGGFLVTYASYDKALEVSRRLVDLCEITYGEDHAETANSYIGMGLIYDYRGESQKALELYQKALTILKKVLGEEHPETASLYNNMACVYCEQGEFQSALEYNRKALAIKEKVLDHDNLSIANSYNNIGTTLHDLGNYSDALEYHQKALSIRKIVYGDEHPDISASYINIGNVFASQKNYLKALEYYMLTLKLCIKYFGEEHPKTANSYNNIGLIYKNQGNLNKSLEFYQKALNVRIKVFGENHPETASSYQNIGNLYAAQKNNQKASEYQLKALEIREKILGLEHPDTASSYNCIGCLYEGYEAIVFFQKALTIREKALGIEHPDTLVSYTNVGIEYCKIQEYEKAFVWYSKAAEKGFDAAQFSLGSMYLNGDGVSQDYAKAMEWYTKAAEQGYDKAQYKLGWMYQNGKGVDQDFSKALEWYSKAAEQGYDKAQYNLGCMYLNGDGVAQDYATALEWYSKAAEQGYDKAQYNLGWMNQNGKGIAQNPSQALDWYTKAAVQGHAIAQYCLGCMYLNGDGAVQDYAKALEWYTKAAEQGNDKAQNNLGWMYQNGKGVAQNPAKALGWYTKAAEQGHVGAQFNIGKLFLFGNDVPQDLTQAMIWLDRAAEQKFEPAYNELAWTLHLMGRYPEALPWAEKAVTASPDNVGIIDTLATVYQGLGRYEEALTQFELCLKLQQEQKASEDSIKETEEKIAEVKELMKK